MLTLSINEMVLNTCSYIFFGLHFNPLSFIFIYLFIFFIFVIIEYYTSGTSPGQSVIEMLSNSFVGHPCSLLCCLRKISVSLLSDLFNA